MKAIVCMSAVAFSSVKTGFNQGQLGTSELMKESKMKAIVGTEYGSPDVLKLKEVAKPTPNANELLIKVKPGF